MNALCCTLTFFRLFIPLTHLRSPTYASFRLVCLLILLSKGLRSRLEPLNHLFSRSPYFHFFSPPAALAAGVTFFA